MGISETNPFELDSNEFCHFKSNRMYELYSPRKEKFEKSHEMYVLPRGKRIQIRLLPGVIVSVIPLSSVCLISSFFCFYEILTFCLETLKPLNDEV